MSAGYQCDVGIIKNNRTAYRLATITSGVINTSEVSRQLSDTNDDHDRISVNNLSTIENKEVENRTSIKTIQPTISNGHNDTTHTKISKSTVKPINIWSDSKNIGKSRKNKMRPNLITADQRKASKLRRLRAENKKLEERITNMSIITNETVPCKNRFQVLSDMEQDEERQVNINDAFQITKNTIKTQNSVANTETQGEPKAKQPERNDNIHIKNNNNTNNKTIKPPPIHIHRQTMANTITLIKGLEINDFELKRVNSEKHTIITKNINDYSKIKQVLNEVNTKYFTYTPKGCKPNTVVLKGLNEDENVDELKNDIENNGNIKISNITQLKTKKSIELNKKLPIYIVQFEPNTERAKIYNIKVINYQRVSWEILKKTNEIMQCRNCQRLGHAASNCKLEYRCVKCHSRHMPGECTITDKVESTDIYCVNCNEKGHPASFRGCPVYQRAIINLRKKIQERRLSQRKNKTPHTDRGIYTTYTQENITYADTLKKNKEEGLTIQNLATKIELMAKTIKQQSEQIAQLLKIIEGI